MVRCPGHAARTSVFDVFMIIQCFSDPRKHRRALHSRQLKAPGQELSRILFLVLSLLSGIGIVLYLLLWILAPVNPET